MPPTQSIIVPIRGQSAFIEVFLNELPEDPSDVIEALRTELASLDIWCDVAIAYHAQGAHNQFRKPSVEFIETELLIHLV